ncbi:bacteriohemerythrin [Propionivibrio dicarboxylicus]|uniref:Hemerythrin-like metal-binding domain protein n=1 Tax=Propionivibrio dicarboxylicus TaxID=83767 RepID=A0A1G8EQE6_9RHOO|nr:hemerythrin family protein [Propionivibrio dicarboxylicus]SDH72062.1 hemerythrin-like metal-binding domain protein [Propionivibrio dicarboxylicus]
METAKLADLREKLDIAQAIMDADHQRCNRLVAQMIELSSFPNMRFEIFGELVQELKQYALSHYAREESFMEICEFPGAAEHKREHAQQLNEISKISVAVMRNDQPAAHQLMLCIFATWQKHRDNQDIKLSDFICVLEH